MVYDVISSPVGELVLVASDRGLHAVQWRDEIPADWQHQPDHPVLRQTRQQLNEYFAGQRRRFALPLQPSGTPFQLQAWAELARIPYGTTISYAEQAERLGDRRKARAIGMANARNPLAIIVPCHRVVASSGDLSGFGGGVENKRRLLNLESAAKPN